MAISKTGKEYKTGRPCKYKEEYCQEIIEWFDKEPFDYLVIDDKETGERIAAIDKFGNPIMTPTRLPTLENFAKHLGVGTSTISDWKHTYPEFSAALTRAKEIQKDILVQNGLFGNYEKTFAKFVAVNVTDMSDKSEVKQQVTEVPLIQEDI